MFLRRCAAAVKADNMKMNWEAAQEEMYHILALKGRFSLMAYAKNMALLEFMCESDRDTVLDAKEIYLSGGTLTSKRWSLGAGTLSQDHLKIRDRWIILQGIPFHLWSSEIFSLVCSSSSVFKKVEVLESDLGDASKLRALVEVCDTKKMPVRCWILD